MARPSFSVCWEKVLRARLAAVGPEGSRTRYGEVQKQQPGVQGQVFTSPRNRQARFGVALRRKHRDHCGRVGTRLFDPGRCWGMLQAFTAQRFLKKR
jgi:hypothetical protein